MKINVVGHAKLRQLVGFTQESYSGDSVSEQLLRQAQNQRSRMEELMREGADVGRIAAMQAQYFETIRAAQAAVSQLHYQIDSMVEMVSDLENNRDV